MIGPIPNGLKSIVSYGLATITTAKIIPMISTILGIPYFILALSAAGLACYVTPQIILSSMRRDNQSFFMVNVHGV